MWRSDQVEAAPAPPTLARVLDVARALADPSRLTALVALAAGEMCLCQVVDLLGLAPSTVSKHMNQLLAAGLVERRKVGRWHYFRVAGDAAPPEVSAALEWLRSALAGVPDADLVAQRACCVRDKDLAQLVEVYG
jgi:DNA-binding transcriptional ArsR family regulator